MLNLIAGEFAKLKRKKIVPFIILLSLLFPLIVVYTSKMGMGNDTSVEFLKVSLSLSIKNSMEARIPNRHGSKKTRPYPSIMV